MRAKKYMNKIGLEGEDYHFFKQVGKALLCTYAILGALWLSNENSTMDWGKLKPWPKEELVQDQLSRIREFLHLGDKGLEEFTDKGLMIGATSGLKGVDESDKDAENNQKELQSKKFDQEAQNLWLKMRNEVIAELKEKGFDVE